MQANIASPLYVYNVIITSQAVTVKAKNCNCLHKCLFYHSTFALFAYT